MLTEKKGNLVVVVVRISKNMSWQKVSEYLTLKRAKVLPANEEDDEHDSERLGHFALFIARRGWH